MGTKRFLCTDDGGIGWSWTAGDGDIDSDDALVIAIACGMHEIAKAITDLSEAIEGLSETIRENRGK